MRSVTKKARCWKTVKGIRMKTCDLYLSLSKGRRLAILWLGIWIIAAMALSTWDLSHELSRTLQGPSLTHPLGFDAFGRDLLLLTLKSSAVSLVFSLMVVFLSSWIAVVLGSLLAIGPEKIRFFGARFLEGLLAFPSLLFALGWAAIRGPGWLTLSGSLALGILPSFTRLIYTRARELVAEDFILAAQSLGSSTPQILFRHFFPHLLSTVRVKAPNLFSHALLAEATLSFLGVGVPIGQDSWGSLLAQGKDYLLEAPHIALGTGIPLILTVLALQLTAEEKTF